MMKMRLLAVAVLSLAVLGAGPDGNIIRNGDFEKGDKYGIPGWHANIMGYMPRETGKDADGNTLFEYVCGCGEVLGNLKPWAGLTCPKCGRYSIAEESGSWYNKNEDCVSLDEAKSGKALHYVLPKAVGENQGVRVVSDLYRVKRNWPYEITAQMKGDGSVIRIFVECYRIVPEDKKPSMKDKATKCSGDIPQIEKTYRAHINCGGGGWKTESKTFLPPPKYAFDYLQVKLYAYMPGEAWFDNIVVRPLMPAEAKTWLDAQKKKKDDRFN